MTRRLRFVRSLLTLCAAAACGACAQTPPSASQPPSAGGATTSIMPATPADALSALAWLKGCWHGTVNQRDFREHWLPSGGGVMVGAGHTVMQGQTQDYEFVRLEVRPDALYYVAVPKDQKEQTFKLVDVSKDDVSGAQIYTFDNVGSEFPQHIIYRRGGEGWLYAGIEGTLDGQDRKVIYPMRHVNCETGEPIRQ